MTRCALEIQKKTKKNTWNCRIKCETEKCCDVHWEFRKKKHLELLKKEKKTLAAICFVSTTLAPSLSPSFWKGDYDDFKISDCSRARLPPARILLVLAWVSSPIWLNPEALISACDSGFRADQRGNTGFVSRPWLFWELGEVWWWSVSKVERWLLLPIWVLFWGKI